MKANAVTLLVLIAVPLASFVVVLNRRVPLVPLEGVEARCLKCDRKATRTLKRVADGLRTKGVYVYPRNEYPNGMPVWCDRHGPNPLRENSLPAYVTALAAFGVAVVVSTRLGRAG